MTTREDAYTVPPVTEAEPEPEPEPEPDEPRRRHRGLVWLALGGTVVAATGAGAWLWVRNASTEPGPAAAGPVATATVERGRISATESFDGTLTRGRPFTVIGSGEGSAEGSSEGSSGGTITRLAEQGESVERGDELYRVNEQPVTLLRGVLPMYRDLAPGDSAIDVKQLEKNLAKLGYGGFTVDDDYTSSTALAVRSWQVDIGAQATGVVSRADVVFLPERGQVDTLYVSVGDTLSPGSPILDVTGTDQVVSLEVDVDDRDEFEAGTKVTVLLPGGDEVSGTVSATAVIDAATEESADGAAGGAIETEPIVQVEVAVNEKTPEEFVGASVDVIAAVEKRTDVLFVPVNALLALAEGGYGLEVVAGDGTTSIVPVETGLFGQGKVEVSGTGITEGTVVGVAGR
jgi:peptidoglycan hydrolase-like protein with peptidoglycan-binding domain